MQQKEERMGANSQLRDRKSCLTIVKFWVNLSLFLGSRLRCTSCAVKDRPGGACPVRLSTIPFWQQSSEEPS